MADEFLPENFRLPRNIQGYFTCRKSTTWHRRLYLPSEERRTEIFFAPINPTASARFEPANLGTKAQHPTSRPPSCIWTLIRHGFNRGKAGWNWLKYSTNKASGIVRVHCDVWCSLKKYSLGIIRKISNLHSLPPRKMKAMYCCENINNVVPWAFNTFTHQRLQWYITEIWMWNDTMRRSWYFLYWHEPVFHF